MTTTTTVQSDSLADVAAAMRRLRHVRGIDAITFVIEGRPWFRADRTQEPGRWAMHAADGQGGWVPLLAA